MQSENKNSNRIYSGKKYEIEPELLSHITHQLAHDIGNPLTSIITYGSIIEQAATLNIPSEKLSDYAKSMLSETWKISILMEKFTLLVSQKAANITTVLSDLSTKIHSRYASRYGLGEFDIELIGFSEHIEVLCESEQLNSVLCEILVNAANELRYLRNKGLEHDFHIILKVDKTSDTEITFTCENPSERHREELAELFTPGFSSHCFSKKNIGIGLPAISHSALRWGGEFTIEEIYANNGHIFKAYLRLPIK